MAAKEQRINRQIRAREVRLIDQDGEMQGVVDTRDALKMAEESGLDLVEVSPNANPPVCKILDFGKFKYENEKKLRESRKNQTQIKLKEIRMQPKIEKHDLLFKTKHIAEFLEEGNKVKVTIRFRGREMAHTELGRVVLDKVLLALQELDTGCTLDRSPKMEGRFMSMILSPSKSPRK
ncbi:MAG: translation initiation factor IF-3 [Spirochaetia bacterium]|nr:translation initiation factor IF-3 [Spirochaetia bacterium]MCF7941026.1 translation initiation factor IF-3 [Spirochaetia bacterium]